nr:zinc finger protein 786-like [Dasypus novemcinctus]
MSSAGLGQLKLLLFLLPDGGAVRAELPPLRRENKVANPTVHRASPGLGVKFAAQRAAVLAESFLLAGKGRLAISVPCRGSLRKAMCDPTWLPLSFEDVAIYFTQQEWQYLEAWQKELYQHVMRTNYETLVSLDDEIPKPELISWIEEGSDPLRNWEESQKSENIICSSADTHFDPDIEGQLFWGSQQTENSKEIKCHFKLDPLPNQYSFIPLLDHRCTKTFLQKNNMQAHQCQNSGESPASCPACSVALSEKSELSSEQSGEKLSQSPDCDGSFLPKEDTEARQHNHSGEKPFSCPKCNKCFPTSSQLAMHFRVHTEEKALQCLKCNKSFHLNGLHSDDKPLRCPKCDITHWRRHTRKKPFSCSECGRRFTYHCKLRDHLRVHSGERPFQCPECGKGFRMKSAVKAHQHTHSKEKPYSCAECGKGFISPGQLTTHYRVHTGERPFQCPKCDKKFHEKRCMLSHLHIHRLERPFSCGDCGKGFIDKSELAEHIRWHAKSHSADIKKKRLSQLLAMIEADWS